MTNDFIDDDWLREQGWKSRRYGTHDESGYGDWYIVLGHNDYVLRYDSGSVHHYNQEKITPIGYHIHSRHDLLYVIGLLKTKLANKQPVSV